MYRFSEDLDFTIRNDSKPKSSDIDLNLRELAKWVYEETGIELSDISVKLFPDSEGKRFRSKIGYSGPLQQGGSLAKIKLDLSQDEVLVEKSCLREVHHDYSDSAKELFKVNAYSYEEIFAEKVRALVERCRPRDLYDVVNLYERRSGYGFKKEVFLEILGKKLAFRKIPMLSVQKLIGVSQKEELVQEWENMLQHQINLLPQVSEYFTKLDSVLEGLEI